VWGITNALMKMADERFTTPQDGFLKNWRWIVCFLFNQSGSLLFYLTLRDADISLVVPVCQATTLAFTVIGSFVFGESFQGDLKCAFCMLLNVFKRLTTRQTGTIAGLVLVSAGVAIMRNEEY
jgi:multidrug transporter EmrE-like cation transporter